MAYYKVRIEVWCDWNPRTAPSKKLPRTLVWVRPFVRRREVVNVVNRPQDIEDDEAMTFFGGEEGDAEHSQG
jgi:hypothetical protein